MHREDSKILLLETPFMSQTGSEEARAYVQSKYNLALLALGSYVEARSDLKVSLINMVKDRLQEDELIERLRRRPPAVVGVPLYSYNLGYSYAIIRRLKREFPETFICAGGPHVAIFPRETAQLEDIDCIVVGDGERPFLSICEQVIESGALHELPPGTYTRESLDAGVALEPHQEKDLDSLPLPDPTLLGDYTRYRDFLSNKIMAIFSTSRGCPYVCHYCWSEKSTYRQYSIDYVIRALRHFEAHGIEYVEFWDETFNPNKKRLNDFADAISEAGIGLTWAVRGAVVNHAPYDTLVKLRKAGLKIIQFGVETGNPKMAKFLNKRLTPEMVKSTFETCRRAGIRTVANMMINLPGQTEEELAADLSFLEEIRPTYLSISVYNWAPGTVHYAGALATGVLENDFWRAHARAPALEDPVVHARTEIPIERVYRLRGKFNTKYYFNYRYIREYLRHVDFREIRRAAAIAMLVLKTQLFGTEGIGSVEPPRAVELGAHWQSSSS